MDVFQSLLETPRSGIVAIYNRKKHKAQLVIAKNLASHLATIATEIRDGIYPNREIMEDRNNLEMIVLETLNGSSPEEDYETLKLHMHYWYMYCNDLGMSFYSKRLYVMYKARTRVDIDLKGTMKVFVDLVSRNNKSFVVGVFDKMDEAKEFVKTYFKEDEYIYPVYANNHHTKEYLEELGKRVDRRMKVRM